MTSYFNNKFETKFQEFSKLEVVAMFYGVKHKLSVSKENGELPLVYL